MKGAAKADFDEHLACQILVSNRFGLPVLPPGYWARVGDCELHVRPGAQRATGAAEQRRREQRDKCAVRVAASSVRPATRRQLMAEAHRMGAAALPSGHGHGGA